MSTPARVRVRALRDIASSLENIPESSGYWTTVRGRSSYQRQQVYLRALRTLPGVTVHLGHFFSNKSMMPLARPAPGAPRFVEVIRTDEKGSDVNLASWLLHDGFQDDFEVAAVISNDSDLATPVRMVRDELRRPIFVMMPRDRHSQEVTGAATYCKAIRAWSIQESQFPREVPDSEGRIIRCPERGRDYEDEEPLT